MNKRTETGAEMQTQTEGLALYLGTAERNRLEAFNPPEETPERIERFLPYALALDMAETWADKFAKDYVPVWFHGELEDIGGLAPYITNLNRAIDNTVRSYENSTSASSGRGSSSGSSGGGSVGRGGGGGGGEGW